MVLAKEQLTNIDAQVKKEVLTILALNECQINMWAADQSNLSKAMLKELDQVRKEIRVARKRLERLKVIE